eukprot:scaffold206901_cov45-Prasinocladus_malaysianus.AAC.1
MHPISLLHGGVSETFEENARLSLLSEGCCSLYHTDAFAINVRTVCHMPEARILLKWQKRRLRIFHTLMR